MAGSVKATMQGFITDARVHTKMAKEYEERCKECKEVVSKTHECCAIRQQEQKTLDSDLEQFINGYHDANSKREKATLRFHEAETQLSLQSQKLKTFEGATDRLKDQTEEVEKKILAVDERMAETRKGLKEAHFHAVKVDKEVSIKQSEIKAALLDQHEAEARVDELSQRLVGYEKEADKYNQIAEAMEAKCDDMERQLYEMQARLKETKERNLDVQDAADELHEQKIYLSMNLRKQEQRADFAAEIVEKLEAQCEQLNESLFLENAKFMELSRAVENQQQAAPKQQLNLEGNEVERMLAPSTLALPMSPMPITSADETQQQTEDESVHDLYTRRGGFAQASDMNKFPVEVTD